MLIVHNPDWCFSGLFNSKNDEARSHLTPTIRGMRRRSWTQKKKKKKKKKKRCRAAALRARPSQNVDSWRRISIFEIDAIPWQNPSRPIPNFLLTNLIEKIGKIAPYHCKNQPLSIEAGYVNIHRFLGVSSLTKI